MGLRQISTKTNKKQLCFQTLINVSSMKKRETDLSDLSDSWRDTYYANFQINQINPLPFNLSNLRLENLLSPSKKNRIKPIKTDKNNKINRKCFTLFSFVFIGFSKWRKQLIIN